VLIIAGARRIDQKQIKTVSLGQIPTKLRDPHPIESVFSLSDHRSSQSEYQHMTTAIDKYYYSA